MLWSKTTTYHSNFILKVRREYTHMHKISPPTFTIFLQCTVYTHITHDEYKMTLNDEVKSFYVILRSRHQDVTFAISFNVENFDEHHISQTCTTTTGRRYVNVYLGGTVMVPINCVNFPCTLHSHHLTNIL